MLTLLARMGLRAGEVAGLALEDIDWRNGESIVVGKLSCRDRLALPADSGEAIAAYLQHGRPAGALDRSVFVRARAPWSCAARKLDHVADLAVYSAGGAVMVG